MPLLRRKSASARTKSATLRRSSNGSASPTKRNGRSNDDDDFVSSGFDADSLKKELESGGGNADPETVRLYDGDQMTVTFVSPINKFARFYRHYLGQGPSGGYRVCRRGNCGYCDDGLRASKVTLCGVYVHQRYQAENENYPARETKNEGYKYFLLSKEATDSLIRIQKRRKTLADYQYVVERSGGGTDTKYEFDRATKRVDPKILRGWRDMDCDNKVRRMAAAESAEAKGGKARKGRSRDDDDDYDYDEELDDELADLDDDEDEEDERPRRRRSSRPAARSGRRTLSRSRR